MSANTSRQPQDFAPAIARLREIAEQAGNALLTEGPVNPDHELLELCADALHHLTEAKKAENSRPSTGGEWNDAVRDQDARLRDEYHARNCSAKRTMLKIKNQRATTPAGIYAKAQVVRASVTGAAVLAMSLAADLIDNPTLRMILWPAAEGER